MTKTIWTGLCMATLTLFAGVASAGNIVVDGGFENGNTAGTGYAAVWNPDGSVGISLGVSEAEISDFPQAGLWYAYFGQAIPITNTITQALATTINDSYTLTYWVAISPINASDEDGGEDEALQTQLAVGVGTSFTTDYFPESLTYTQAYQEFTENFVASSGTTNLQFAGADDWNSLILLDSISVIDNGSAVPEPATLALAGAGLLIAGLCRKTKR